MRVVVENYEQTDGWVDGRADGLARVHARTHTNAHTRTHAHTHTHTHTHAHTHTHTYTHTYTHTHIVQGRRNRYGHYGHGRTTFSANPMAYYCISQLEYDVNCAPENDSGMAAARIVIVLLCRGGSRIDCRGGGGLSIPRALARVKFYVLRPLLDCRGG